MISLPNIAKKVGRSVSPIIDSVLGFNKLGHMQRNYNWSVLLPDMGSIAGEVISKYCQDVKFGEYSLTDVVTMKQGAFQAFYAGYWQIPPVSLIFVVPSAAIQLNVDSILHPTRNMIRSYFNIWKELMLDSNGFYSEKGIYVKDIHVMLEDSTGVSLDAFVLEKAFPKTMPSYDLSYSGNDILKVTVEFSIDNVKDLGIWDALKNSLPGAIGRQVIGRLPRLF